MKNDNQKITLYAVTSNNYKIGDKVKVDDYNFNVPILHSLDTVVDEVLKSQKYESNVIVVYVYTLEMDVVEGINAAISGSQPRSIVINQQLITDFISKEELVARHQIQYTECALARHKADSTYYASVLEKSLKNVETLENNLSKMKEIVE